MSTSQTPIVAAIVPCYNEALSISKVVADLHRAVPGIRVYVYDNNSSDGTADIAREAGAIVRAERTRGKGNVVRRAFADVDADVYVLIDGDDTYSVDDLPEMIRTLMQGPFDHVLGVRREESDGAYRPGHELGNKSFNWLVSRVFGNPVSDMLSGYRVFSKRFVKSFPALSKEFEIETELTVHAMSLRAPQVEVNVGFRDRPPGSESKLRTYHDGLKILGLIVGLVRHELPLVFYGMFGTIFALLSGLLGLPVVIDFIDTGLVERLPTAVLSVGIAILAVLSFTIGLVLDGVLKARREVSRLNYLRLPAPIMAP